MSSQLSGSPVVLSLAAVESAASVVDVPSVSPVVDVVMSTGIPLPAPSVTGMSIGGGPLPPLLSHAATARATRQKKGTRGIGVDRLDNGRGGEKTRRLRESPVRTDASSIPGGVDVEHARSPPWAPSRKRADASARAGIATAIG